MAKKWLDDKKTAAESDSVLDAADKARDGKEEVDSGQSDVDYHREELVFCSIVSTSMQHRPEQHVTCERGATLPCAAPQC